MFYNLYHVNLPDVVAAKQRSALRSKSLSRGRIASRPRLSTKCGLLRSIGDKFNERANHGAGGILGRVTTRC